MSRHSTRVCDRARRQLESNSRTDMAPGENHISFRKDGVDYYSPNVFHMAPAMKVTLWIPMLVKDLLKVKNAEQVYHQRVGNQVGMYGNVPLQRVSVMGRIQTERFIERPTSNGTKTMYFVEINDSSSCQMAVAKVECGLYTESGLKFQQNSSRLVQVKGTVSFFIDRTEIYADSIEIVGNRGDLSLEIDWWDKALNARGDLLNNWTMDLDNEPDEFFDAQEFLDEQPKAVELDTAVETVHEVESQLLLALIRQEAKTIRKDALLRDWQLARALDRLTGIESATVLDWLLKSLETSQLIKYTPDGRIKTRKIYSLFRYLLNLLGFLSNTQETEARKAMSKAARAKDRHRYKRVLEKYIERRIQYSIDLASVKYELRHRFNLQSIKADSLNTLIRELINGDHLVRGGLGNRQFPGQFQYTLVLQWSYDDLNHKWSYVPQVNSSR